MKKTRKKQADTDPTSKKRAEEEVKRRILEENSNYFTEAKKKSRKKQVETNPTGKKKAEVEVRKIIVKTPTQPQLNST